MVTVDRNANAFVSSFRMEGIKITGHSFTQATFMSCGVESESG
jgi:hypothetical protein